MLFIRNIALSFVLCIISANCVFAEEVIDNNIVKNTMQKPNNIKTNDYINNEDEVTKLELAGSDSFEYDIANKIRKTKSGVNVGVGANFIYNIQDNGLQVNVSAMLGYSYFFYKTFGIRLNGIFDNNKSGFYSGASVDVMWDFIQTEPFGIGILIGSSIGYREYYLSSKYGQLLGQFHSGIGFIFDSGRSRIDTIVRIPYNNIESYSKIYNNITYVIMYSYTF